MAQWKIGEDTFGHIEDCSGPADHLGDCIPAGTIASLVGMTRNAEGYWEDTYGLPQDTAPHGIRCGAHPREMGIRHENAAAVRACHSIGRMLQEEARAELYAEAGSSWMAGGGSPEDARIYASVIASGRTWEEYLGVA